MFKKVLYTAIALFLIFSCQEDDEVVYTPPLVADSTLTVDLSGYVQKGPFINGTAITLSELDKKLVTTGKNFTTQIADNKGSFSLKGIKLKSNFVQLQADGFYFDEVKGEKSAAQLTLFALSDVEDISSINANLLSHMERTRVIYLMQEEEKAFAEAKQQAQQEILTVFGIEKEEMQQSELLDISQDGEDNAILLAISAVLQANNTVSELSELVANLITDLREDGVLSSQNNKDKIKEQGKVLNLPQIRANLEKRYEDMGIDAIIPNFEQYIDSDGDGILNKDEDDTPDEFVFTLQKEVAINTAITSNAVKISGLKEGGTADAIVKKGQLILNGNVSSDSVVQVKNGDQLQLQLISSPAYADTMKATVSIGTVVKHFQVISDDYVPDAFIFTAQKDVAVDSFYTSNTITVNGIPFPTPLKIEGGVLIKNGEALPTDTTSVKNGDKLSIKLLSSSAYASATSATLDINGVTASFELTTDDYKPDAFSFKAQKDVAVATYYFSDTITISGLLFSAPLTIKGGTLIKNGKVLTTDSTTVRSGDKLAVKLLSSSEFQTATSASIKINGVIASFNTTTDDYTPDNFSFTPVVNAYTNTFYTSETITLTGLPYPSPIALSAGTLHINGKKNSSTDQLYVREGDQIAIQLKSDYGYLTTVSAKLRIGLGEWDFSVTSHHDPCPEKPSFPGTEPVAGFAVENKIYVVSGTGKTFMYDPQTDIWTQKSDFSSGNRYGSVGFSINGKGYIGLGYSRDAGSEILLKDFWEYDPVNDSWSQIADFGGEARSSASVFVLDDKAYIGLGKSDEVYFKDFWEYDPSVNTWVKKHDFGGPARAFAFSFALAGKAYVGTGYMGNEEYKPDVWEYHPSTNSWVVKNDYPYLTEYGNGFIVNDIAYVLDGIVRQYDVEGDQWIVVPSLFYDTGGVCFSTGDRAFLLWWDGHFREFIPVPQQ